jgi:hypothetical protein
VEVRPTMNWGRRCCQYATRGTCTQKEEKGAQPAARNLFGTYLPTYHGLTGVLRLGHLGPPRLPKPVRPAAPTLMEMKNLVR